MSLTSAKLTSLSAKLPRLDAAIGARILHVRFLTSSAENFEERVLLETVNHLRRDVLALRGVIAEAMAELETVKRSGARDSTTGGQLASASGLSRRIQRRFAELDAELRILLKKAEDRLNDPGRYGDAALGQGPYFELISFAQSFLDLVVKAMKRSG